jgi:acyl-CoA thioester hydrolase
MGFIYYGNYAQYYEVARVELMRKLGLSYSELEDFGVLMPVIDLHINFKKPAFYDEEITIACWIDEIPVTRMKFFYHIFNSKLLKINEGSTTLIFLNKRTGKPIKCPELLSSKVLAFIP